MRSEGRAYCPFGSSSEFYRIVIVPAGHADVLTQAPYSEVQDVEIGGPGLVKTDGGLVGDGIGVAGVIEAMAIAAVLNAMTTRSSIKTLLRIQADSCELFLLHTTCTPRTAADPTLLPLAAIRTTRADSKLSIQRGEVPGSPIDELTKLAAMLESGLITRDEFNLVKTNSSVASGEGLCEPTERIE